MEERFEVYKREVVARFYEDHFRRFSRQIVLVDVLRALLAGREAFEDQRLALEAILQSFRYGSGGMFSKLLWGPHIDKVLFAATKADHVPDIQRDHLAELLRNMAAFPAIEVEEQQRAHRRDARSPPSSRPPRIRRRSTASACRSWSAGRSAATSRRSSSSAPCRSGRRGPDTWDAPFLNVPVFEPPAIDPSPVEGIPHINLDLALEFLLGDRLR